MTLEKQILNTYSTKPLNEIKSPVLMSFGGIKNSKLTFQGIQAFTFQFVLDANDLNCLKGTHFSSR